MEIITDENYKILLKDADVYAILFSSDYCPPCTVSLDMFERMSEFKTVCGFGVAFFLYSVDSNSGLAAKLGVKMTPTSILFNANFSEKIVFSGVQSDYEKYEEAIVDLGLNGRQTILSRLLSFFARESRSFL